MNPDNESFSAESNHVKTSGNRPRLLFLCQTLPYPPVNGVLIRTYNVLRILARTFDVTALCFFRKESHGTEHEVRESVEALQKLARIKVFPIPQEHSRTRLITDHCRSLMAQRAYTIYTYESSEFRKELRSRLREESFDLVHVDSLDLAGYLPLLAHLPVVCVHHNVESRLLQRRAETTGGLLGLYIAAQAHLTEREERKWCPRLNLNIAVSQPDKNLFAQIAPSARFTVVPNGVDTSRLRPGNEEEEGIVFVGSHGWQPNRDAMEYFCSEVLPILRARGITTPVTWIGRASPKVVREYAERYGVTLSGFVEDFRPLVQRAACYVAPLRAGGGTRLKILDAWAMGKAVVSTAVGCEGLDARDGHNILIRDSAEDFATAVERVLQDSTLRTSLGVSGRRTAEDFYDWEIIGKEMLREYRTLVANSGPTPGGS